MAIKSYKPYTPSRRGMTSAHGRRSKTGQSAAITNPLMAAKATGCAREIGRAHV